MPKGKKSNDLEISEGEASIWDEIIEKANFITFKDKNVNRVKFLVNNPTPIETIFDEGTDKEKKQKQYRFKVIDLNDKEEEKVLDTSSSRLLTALKELLPIKDNSYRIERIGTQFNTRYEVTRIE